MPNKKISGKHSSKTQQGSEKLPPAVNISSLGRKLASVQNTHDSIAMLGVWMICIKYYHKEVTSRWLDTLRSSNQNHRLTLFYLCNDIVQKCERKNAHKYKESFKKVIPEAIVYISANNSETKQHVARVITIWKNRNVYDSDWCDELLACIECGRVPTVLKNSFLARLDLPDDLIQHLAEVNTLSNQILPEINGMKNMEKFDMQKTKTLKDKLAGEKCLEEVDEKIETLQSNISNLKLLLSKQKVVRQKIQTADIFFHSYYYESKKLQGSTTILEKIIGTSQKSLDKILDSISPQHQDMEISDDEETSSPVKNTIRPNFIFEDKVDLNTVASLPIEQVQNLINQARAEGFGDELQGESTDVESYQAAMATADDIEEGEIPPGASPDANVGSSPGNNYDSLESRIQSIFNKFDKDTDHRRHTPKKDQDLRVHNKTNTPTSSSSIIQDNDGTSEHNSPTLPGLGGQKTAGLSIPVLGMEDEGGTTPVQDESPSIGDVGKAMSFLSNFMKQQVDSSENATNNIVLTSNNDDVNSQNQKETEASAWLAAYAESDCSDDEPQSGFLTNTSTSSLQDAEHIEKKDSLPFTNQKLNSSHQQQLPVFSISQQLDHSNLIDISTTSSEVNANQNIDFRANNNPTRNNKGSLPNDFQHRPRMIDQQLQNFKLAGNTRSNLPGNLEHETRMRSRAPRPHHNFGDPATKRPRFNYEGPGNRQDFSMRGSSRGGIHRPRFNHFRPQQRASFRGNGRGRGRYHGNYY